MNDLEAPKPDLCWFCGKPNTDYEDLDLLARVHDACKWDAMEKYDKVKAAVHNERIMNEATGSLPLHPCQGGCWYCHMDGCDRFDSEFDTMLHLDCLRRVLEIDPNHPEGRCQSYLLDDHVQPPNKDHHTQD